MTVLDLLCNLNALKVGVDLADGRLRVVAPPGALTPELRATVASHKPALAAILEAAAECRRLWRLVAEKGAAVALAEACELPGEVARLESERDQAERAFLVALDKLADAEGYPPVAAQEVAA